MTIEQAIVSGLETTLTAMHFAGVLAGVLIVIWAIASPMEARGDGNSADG